VRIKISARQSALSRIQAFTVGLHLTKIKQTHSRQPIEIEYLFRESLGDKNLTEPLWKIPEKGVFTADFYQDLVNGKTDMVVHSWKDLPTEISPDTMIAGTLPRADARDMLLLKKNSWGKKSLKFFSSSPRRAHNLQNLIPQLMPWPVVELGFESVRGNVQTRVRKLLESSEVDGLILAKAAFDRLLTTPSLRQEFENSVSSKTVAEVFEKSWPEFQEVSQFLRSALEEVHWMVLPLSQNPTAAAQGALAIEIRRDRKDLIELLKSVNSESTFQAVEEERNLLRSFGGGCHLALGMSVQKQAHYSLVSVRGKTPEGEQLLRYDFNSEKQVPKFQASELWSWSESQIERRPLASALSARDLEVVVSGFVVSRREALPDDWSAEDKQKLHLWTSGFQTWKKLALAGYWVHGTYDGLGDAEDPDTGNILSGIKWYRLTHDKNPNLLADRHIATYSVDLETMNPIAGEKFFFWRSGSQFLEALLRYPHIENLWHAAGPGSTLITLKQHLPAEVYDKQVFIFNNEEDWRKKCQK
jgi:hydroxymethylbilane synthase